MEKQTNIADAQNRIAIADERPWIRWKIESVDDMVITETALQFSFVISPLNVGKSPATYVSSSVSMIRALPAKTGEGPQERNTQKNEMILQCELAEQQTIAKQTTSPTIFQNDQIEYPSHHTFSMAVASFLVDWSRPPDAHNSEIWIAPEAVGCIAYMTYIDDKIHHTRFAVQFSRKIENDHRLIVSSGPQTIKGSDIYMNLSPLGINDVD